MSKKIEKKAVDEPLNLQLNKYADAKKRPDKAGFFNRNQNHTIGTEIKGDKKFKSPPKKKTAVKKVPVKSSTSATPANATAAENQGDK